MRAWLSGVVWCGVAWRGVARRGVVWCAQQSVPRAPGAAVSLTRGCEWRDGCFSLSPKSAAGGDDRDSSEVARYNQIIAMIKRKFPEQPRPRCVCNIGHERARALAITAC